MPLAKTRPIDDSSKSLVIAIINSNDDLVRVVRDSLVGDGFNVVTAHIREIKAGQQDFTTFLRGHNPTVIVTTSPCRTKDNWTFFQTLRQLPEARHRNFVITTVNKRVLDQRIGPTEAIEIQGGRADDLEPVLEAVHKVVKSRT